MHTVHHDTHPNEQSKVMHPSPKKIIIIFRTDDKSNHRIFVALRLKMGVAASIDSNLHPAVTYKIAILASG